jgi:hypothetical protein
MLQVFYPLLIEDEDVIQIHHQKIIGERPQDIVHHPHEIFWGIFQAKGHDQPFFFFQRKNIINSSVLMTNHTKKHFFGLEGSISYIGILYWDLVVAEL